MSRFLLPPENGSSPTRKRKYTRRSKAISDPSDEVESEIPLVPSGTARQVTLKSGGTLTVTASMDVFKLSPADRTFVFSLIDKLSEYESPPEKSGG
jgi:hypothetical protein